LQEELREQLETLKSSGFPHERLDESTGSRSQIESLRKKNTDLKNRIAELVESNEKLKKRDHSGPSSSRDSHERMH
jgi:uncharacterized coiled-coil DUF342 family protein